MLRQLMSGLRSLFQKGRMEEELDQELQFHLEMETRENLKRGLPAEEAYYAARRSFGGVEQVKEACRDARGIGFIETLGQDARFALRTLAKRPGFAAVVVATLGLGIGANTAIFSVINGVLLRPLPYEGGDQLVVIRQQAPLADIDSMPFSVKEIFDYRRQNQTLDAVVEYHTMPFILLGRGEPERVQTGVVSAEFFDVLKIQPWLGRTFLPGEDEPGAEPVLLLSYEYWQASHGGDPKVVGKSFEMNDRLHTVVGVLPPLPQFPNENDVYMATSSCPFRSSEAMRTNRNARMMSVFGKLKPQVSLAQAQTDLSTIASRLREEYRESYPDNQGYAVASTPLREELTEEARPTLLVLWATVGLVLMIACANVANLTLSRLLHRERELAVRAALGAGRGRLLRQLLTESTLLAMMGGALGLLFAAGTLDALTTFTSRFTPRAAEISIDNSVLLFTLLVSLATGVIFGAIPAFTAKPDVVSALNEGSGRATTGAGGHRVRNLLVVAQVAISLILLTGAGLMIRSFVKLQRVDGGFNAERVLTMLLDLNWSKYDDAEKLRNFHGSLLPRVQALPGVVSAAITRTFPLNEIGPLNRSLQIEGSPIEEGQLLPAVDMHTASPDYFQTVGIPLIKGRTFTETDHQDAPPVAIINQSLARHYWKKEEPIGRRISVDGGEPWMTIVGVLGDVKQYGLDSDVEDVIYLPLAQRPFRVTSLVVRTAAEPWSMGRQLTQAVYEVDPEQPVARVRTLEEVRSNSIAAPRLTTVLLGLFAGLALIITAAGISGVLALSVSQRTHEIGIRMAFGATRRDMLKMVLKQGVSLVLIGLALGVGGACVLAHLISGLLFGIEPTDPVTFVAVSLVLVAVAIVASLVPARRATSIDPMTALRSN
jgi:predicted permease